jgi:thiol-disulfide isomerase/thioredoxin
VGGRTRAPRRVVALVVASVTVLAGCSVGKNAVVRGSVYTFVAPGGKTQIFYDPPSARGNAPDITGESLTAPGKQIGLSNDPGQVVVVNIWGSWCGPCRTESPELEQAYHQTEASGVRFLGIDVRDTRSAAQDFVRAHGVTYPSIFDPPGRSLLALQGYPRNVVPSTIVLDREHRVAAVFLQAIVAGQLLPVLQRLATENTTPRPTTGRTAP